MDVMIVMYSVIGGMTFLALIVTLMIVAGKDIAFAFFRRFNPKGSDVFITNPNRYMEHYYETAKDGVFKINGNIYITNPNKMEKLSDDMKKEIAIKKDANIKRINQIIDKLELNKQWVKQQIELLGSSAENASKVSDLQMHYNKLDEHISTLKDKINYRENSYFMQRRSAYFYIEGDPIPKDFYEMYTQIDSVCLENIIIRAQTKDPKDFKKLEDTINWVKKFVIFALIAAGIAAFFAFRGTSMLEQMAQAMGVTLAP